MPLIPAEVSAFPPMARVTAPPVIVSVPVTIAFCGSTAAVTITVP